jgi:hypothetical protein
MAARHAAWRVAGNPGVNPQTLSKEINEDFFFNSFAVVQNGDPPVDHVGTTGMRIINAILFLHDHIDGSPSYRVKVTFGISQKDLDSSNLTFPFNLMKTHVPFMTDSLMADFLTVHSQCQWPATGDPWLTQPSDPMKRAPLSWLKSVGDTMNRIFNVWNSAYTHAKWIFVDWPKCILNCAAHPWRPCHCNEPGPADFGCHP